MDELQKTAVDCRPGKVYGRSKLKNVKDPKSLVLVLYRVRIQYLYIQISWSLYARLFRQWFTRRFTYTWTHFLISLGSTSHSDAHVRIFYASCVKLSKRDKKNLVFNLTHFMHFAYFTPLTIAKTSIIIFIKIWILIPF